MVTCRAVFLATAYLASSPYTWSHIVLTNPVEDMSYVVTSKDMQFTFLYYI